MTAGFCLDRFALESTTTVLVELVLGDKGSPPPDLCASITGTRIVEFDLICCGEFDSESVGDLEAEVVSKALLDGDNDSIRIPCGLVD